jgi:hypothetical protein
MAPTRLVAFYAEYYHLHIVTNHDGFANAPSQNQHRFTSL